MANYVIKVGGEVVDQQEILTTLLLDIQLLMQEGHSCVLVHGGGSQLSMFCKAQNIAAKFDELGRRITGKQEMECTDMILAGSINTAIVRKCLALQISTVGLSGADHGLIVGESLNNTYTGMAKVCNTDIISILCAQSILPVVCPVASTIEGNALNINADECAKTIAIAWNADYLVYITDVPGIISNSMVQQTINAQKVLLLIEEGIIKDGMIAKALNSLEALSKGVESVSIGQFETAGDLLAITRKNKGTTFYHA